MKKIISFVLVLAVVGLLGCGEAKEAGKAEVKKAAEAKADNVKGKVEEHTANPKEVGENVPEGAQGRREGRREERREGR